MTGKQRVKLTYRLFLWMLFHVATKRPPDFVVGKDDPNGPYLHRWWLTPWRSWQSTLRARADAKPTRPRRAAAYLLGLVPNLYLHNFLRDDDDRALHDHPSWAFSLILWGGYVEHTIAAGGIHQRKAYAPGSFRFLRTKHAHRIELHRNERGGAGPCWSLFLFGPTVRDWGFHCPARGWVHWKDFTKPDNAGEVGPGCGA